MPTWVGAQIKRRFWVPHLFQLKALDLKPKLIKFEHDLICSVMESDAFKMSAKRRKLRLVVKTFLACMLIDSRPGISQLIL